MKLDLSEKIVAVTGGRGALGTAIVSGLAELGATVVSIDLAEERVGLDQPRVIQKTCDITDPSAVGVFFAELAAELGRLPDVVCCHAGMVGGHPSWDYPIEEFDELFQLNVRGTFIFAKAAAKAWIDAARPGHLLFTTSWVAAVPWPDIAPYNASKAAVRQLARSMARELAPHQIRVNDIAPGIVAAGMALKQWESDSAYRARAEKAIPLGWLQPIQSVVDAFLFMASDLSSYMTGATLLVDGGASLYPMDHVFDPDI